jgi:hypothetical protein
MLKATAVIKHAYTAGFHKTDEIVEVLISLPGYGCYTKVLSRKEATPVRLRKLAKEGGKIIKETIEKHSTTWGQDTEATVKSAAAV